MIKIGQDIIKHQKKFRNNCIFHPTDAVEDSWGRRIIDRFAKDKSIKTIRVYAVFEDNLRYCDEPLFYNLVKSAQSV